MLTIVSFLNFSIFLKCLNNFCKIDDHGLKAWSDLMFCYAKRCHRYFVREELESFATMAKHQNLLLFT